MKRFICQIILVVLILSGFFARAQQQMRRPISPDQPMWLIHIDTWNYADPQKIIDLVPKDIRPYVVMNIALSISHDDDTYKFKLVEDGLETAKSWLRVCAENRMWATVQPASGGFCHFPDDDLTLYEDLFEEFPNFIGFNYSEQFWGFDQSDNPLSPKWTDRISHFANLLELSNKYGGYLVVSICWNKWVVRYNPIGMLKLNPDFAEACSKYTENYLLFDKHTQVSYLHDRESMSLGAYLSGYSGQYGIRYDDTGWTDDGWVRGSDMDKDEHFTMATYGAPFLEHTMLTGLTMFDGPELIWTQCFTEVNASETTDGYSARKWKTFPQFDNVSVDLFRKVIDGTVRIPSRKEVIDRSKYVLIQNTNTGGEDAKYSSPENLYEGLYLMDNDGNYDENLSFFKKTGRYPTIPIVYGLDDELANTFEHKLYSSNYNSRWSSVSAKVNEMNTKFPQEYTGDMYVGRHENGWVCYNPYKVNQTASASIPFKYNTCEKIEMTFSQYTAGVMKEYEDRLTIYLSNFDNKLDEGLKPDVIKIYGSSSEPTFSVSDRGENLKSEVSKQWSEGVLTLTVEHNGPVDIEINCSGSASNRLSEYKTANITVPLSPPTYTGIRQYEGETFEYKNIARIVKSGYSGELRNYTGQGYLEFGTNAAASVREMVSVLNAGNYTLKTSYIAAAGDVNSIDLYVNGVKVASPTFTQTNALNQWGTNSQVVALNKGANTIEFKANTQASNTVFFDNITIENIVSDDVWLEAECGSTGALWKTFTDTNASNAKYITTDSGDNSTEAAPENTEGHVVYNFSVNESGTYNFWGRVLVSGTNDNAFWLKMNNEDWLAWDIIPAATNWAWVKIDTVSLEAGEQSLTLAYNKTGAHIDKLFITTSATEPSGKGGTAENCTSDKQAPIAYAGFNRTIIDSDDSGAETIVLDGTGSSDADGTIDNYEWIEDGNVLATGANAEISLPVGVHKILLSVTDNDGETAIDEIVITVLESNYYEKNIWLEAECATVGSNWVEGDDAQASNGKYVTARQGFESINSAPANSDGLVSFSFSAPTEGVYSVYARIFCPSYNDDSFWVKMDNGDYSMHNGLASSAGGGWSWYKFGEYNLSVTDHVFTIGYREDGARLDKLFITAYDTEVSGIGEQASNWCGNVSAGTIEKQEGIAWQNYPNPFNQSVRITYRLSKAADVNLKIYNLHGQQIKALVNQYQTAGEHAVEWTPEGLNGGFYLIRLQIGELIETKKIIYQK
ncbi:glycoside hydrolase family 98 domain-containing protein [uncultured Draconibacterium sp.]|uniref:glycoside hydrolase family 98 domain-containing protein n=1 Tax=uncultured Draconibacterium sp. TaxID=1573823 RepID=UPI0025E3A7D1|nr:glycoside hydrolase family 98 domain-containing protein [uncultured Draconibacterium sp.]